MTAPGLTTSEELARAIAPDPELARTALSRLGERPEARDLLDRSDVLAAAVPLLGFSTAAIDFFVANPPELAALADPRPRSLADLLGEALADVKSEGPATGLRRFRRRAAYRLAARDLAGATLDEVVEELTAIAEGGLRTGCEVATSDGSDPPAGALAVVGLGELGGRGR